MMINKLQTLKNDRFYISSIITALSALAFLSSWGLYSQPKLDPDFATKRQSDISMCSKLAVHKGFEVNREGTSVLEVYSDKFSSPKLMFTGIETVIAGCHNVELKNFCLGVEEECGLNGMKLVMVYEGGSVN